MSETTLSWWSPTQDPEYCVILTDTVRDALRGLPDVLLCPCLPPTGFARVLTLCAERVDYLQVTAISNVRDDVEFAIANARILQLGLVAREGSTIPDQQASSSSRAASREAALAAEIIRARERVASTTALHIAQVQATLAYGADALAEVDRLTRLHHLYPYGLAYEVPATPPVEAGVLEIGLARINAALPYLDTTGPTHTTTNSERGEAA